MHQRETTHTPTIIIGYIPLTQHLEKPDHYWTTQMFAGFHPGNKGNFRGQNAHTGGQQKLLNPHDKPKPTQCSGTMDENVKIILLFWKLQPT